MKKNIKRTIALSLSITGLTLSQITLTYANDKDPAIPPKDGSALIKNLNNELFPEIFSYLDGHSYGRAAQVCKQFYRGTQDNRLKVRQLRNAFHNALNNKKSNTLQLIGKAGDDTQKALLLPNHHGENTAHLAVKTKNLEALKIIALNAPQALEAKDSNGNTPTMIAAQNLDWTSLSFLLEKAPHTVHLPNEKGETVARFLGTQAGEERLTPVHVAAREREWHILLLFAKYAPESFLKENAEQILPMEIARAQGMPEDIARKIIKYVDEDEFDVE